MRIAAEINNSPASAPTQLLPMNFNYNAQKTREKYDIILNIILFKGKHLSWHTFNLVERTFMQINNKSQH